EDSEAVASRIFLGPPYQGEFNLGSFRDYLGAAADTVQQLEARLKVSARDGAGNETVRYAAVTLLRNQPPEVNAIDILDVRGFNLGSSLDRITENRGIVVSVQASDLESGVERVRLYQAVGESDSLHYVPLGEDVIAPFQFHVTVPTGRIGSTLAFRAIATDVDGNDSSLSSPRLLTIQADQPPAAEIIQPSNDQSAVIRGQSVPVSVRVEDDLGIEGIDKVEFLVNDLLSYTAYQSVSQTSSSFGQDNIYQANLWLPDGQDGVAIQAIAYDVLGQKGVSQVVRVGIVEDTVVPEIEVLEPAQGDVVTAGEPLRIVVSVRDIGDEDGRAVTQHWVREYRDDTGQWQTLSERQVLLNRNDERSDGDMTPVSQPDQYRYIYWADFADGNLLRREMRRQERLRIVTRVKTANHEVFEETIHEVGLPVDRRRYVLPTYNGTSASSSAMQDARSVYYSALARYQGTERTGAVLAAWNTLDPASLEPDIGNPSLSDIAQDLGEFDPPLRSGVVMLDAMEAVHADGTGREYLYSDLLLGASEIFLGTIGALHADGNFVMAAKSGLPDGGLVRADKEGSFVHSLRQTQSQDPETGGLYTENGAGELLIFGNRNGDGQFGLPYLLAGRVDMPFPDVHGVTRTGNLAFVANGHGGVQVVDITSLDNPYRVSFIKPNGYVRDVAIAGDYLFIAASEEGLIVADIVDPSMPIIARLDTLGVANRLHIAGDRIYVTNMSGTGRVSQLDIIDIRDAYQPTLLRSVAFEPGRPDYVADGVYDLFVSGNLAYVSVFESDQEDRPAQTRVEALKLGLLERYDEDATVPVVVHRSPSVLDYSVRDLLLVDGSIEMAAGRGGVSRAALAELTVVQHTPWHGQSQVSAALPEVLVELSAVLDPQTDLASNIHVYRGQWPFVEDVSEQFSATFGEREGEPAYRFIRVTPQQPGSWQAGETYHVELRTGLAPLGGDVLVMSDSYRFQFTISSAGDASAPDIQHIVPDVGDVNGGTLLTLSGHYFGATPQVLIGGREAVVQSATHDETSGLDQVVVVAPPNYAGPAAVQLTNDDQLRDIRFGGFVYTDALRISFIEPGVVGTSQAGEGDRVNVIGYGFHPGVRLKAWPSGQPDNVTTDSPDRNRLILISAERMEWTVPDLGSSYRGFLDVEISDATGRRYWLPRALFYGKLEVGRMIQTGALPAISEDGGYIPDAGRLPPGVIMDMASDAENGLIYVLGRGVDNREGMANLNVLDVERFRRTQPAGWISLVHYQRDRLDEAAPLHGLGYMNLPQALAPVSLRLTDTHLYVAAHGYKFPFIDVPYENEPALLVYDREDRLPGSQGDGGSRDRDVLYALPLPLSTAPQKLLHTGQLLVAPATDGIALINLANPLRPGIVSVIREAVIDGAVRGLHVLDAHLEGGHLIVHVGAGNRGTRRLVFDLDRPGAPQIGTSLQASGLAAPVLMKDQVGVAGGQSLFLYDVEVPRVPVTTGRYQPSGFSVPGDVVGADAGNSLYAILRRKGCGQSVVEYFVQLLDISRPDSILLQDALQTIRCSEQGARLGGKPALPAVSQTREPILLTDDGLLLTVSPAGPEKGGLQITDTLTQDLRASFPLPNATGVSRDAEILLTFALPVEIPLLETQQNYLSRYITLSAEEESAASLPATLRRDADRPNLIRIIPSQALQPDARYVVTLAGDPAARRTEGFFDHQFSFTTGARLGAGMEILTVATPFVPLSGGSVTVDVRYPGDSPVVLIGGQVAQPLTSEALADGVMRLEVMAPAALPGTATLTVLAADGANASLPGAVTYVEPLILAQVSPAVGSVDGGNTVTLSGRGFRSDAGRLQVLFGDFPADPENIRILDSSTLSVTVPAGSLGVVPVTVMADDGQVARLDSAYEFLQPPQANIQDDTRINHVVMDPTGTWAIAATNLGVSIYNVAASTFTGRPENPLLPDALQRMIDEDGDDIDDRIAARIPLPDNWIAQRVALYFERGTDRVFVSALRRQGDDAIEGALFVLAFDAGDISRSQIIRQLPLPGELARGLIVNNDLAVVAMGHAGIGFVDVRLQDKAYLQHAVALPMPALDVARFAGEDQAGALYVAVGGRYNAASDRLQDLQVPGAGGFHVIRQHAGEGVTLLSALDLQGLAVSVSGSIAWVAAGEGGLVAVDLTDPSRPKIVSREQTLGAVYHVSTWGHVAYALTSRGVYSLDVTDPARPQVVHGQRQPTGSLSTLTATAYGLLVGAGQGANSVLGVFNDVLLKLVGTSPEPRLIDLQPSGDVLLRVRFNKAIDQYPANLSLIRVVDGHGNRLSAQVHIENNDIVVRFPAGTRFAPGSFVDVHVDAGLASVKPVEGQSPVILYRLLSDQSVRFVWRGDRVRNAAIDSVLPRRIPQGQSARLYVSARAVPENIEDVRFHLGGVPLTAQQVTPSSEDGQLMVFSVDTPLMMVPGLFDLAMEFRYQGVWQTLFYRGAVAVDAPLTIESVTPQWGQVGGGNRVLVRGSGFEPGNTVVDGLRVSFGNVPVRELEVLSSELIEVMTP
ncbi:MAG: IPT/TIG domain-containing protein, partial [Alcanivoracaceae bacterium]|nr:IPT/TIG domain-containing protein [Alcanivoracaceae bacterium]